MSKSRRHRLILRLLGELPLKSQEELRRALGAQGITATQGTLSRDLRELGVVKGPGGYFRPKLSTAEEGGAELHATARAHLLRAEPAGTVVVVRTDPGGASVLGAQLDRHPLEGMVGCVAGDDTILLAARSVRHALSIARTLEGLGS